MYSVKVLLKNYRLISFIIISVFAVIGYCYQPAALQKFSLGLEDIKFSARSALGLAPTPDKDIIIIEVDEPSVNKVGRWPWNRDVMSELFKDLSEASVVGLDIVFSETSDEEKDNLLADTIYNNGNIILGYFFRDVATEETTELDVDYLQDCAYMNFSLLDDVVGVKEFPYAEVNIPIIAESALTCAYFSTEPDADGLYRRYPLAYIHKGYILPPLAVQMLRYSLNKEVDLKLDKNGVRSFDIGDIDIKNHSYIRLNFYDEVQYVSAYEVLDGTVPPSYFKDKMVIVGVTEVGVYDMRPTPINSITPGVSLHYVALSNLLQDELLTTSELADYLSIFLTLIVMLGISFMRKQVHRIGLYTVALIVSGGASYCMFFFGNYWQHEFFTVAPSIIFIASLESFAFFTVERKAKEVKKAFSSYVSPALVEEIQKDPDKLKLGGEERCVSIMFSDIRGFTSLSESLSAPELVSMLNKIHGPMTNVVLNNKGMLDKYIGDAMMVLYNTPLDLEDHADMAVYSALELIRTLHTINERFTVEGLPNIDIGIGINTGLAVCGNMGSQVRFEYTAIGDSVNLASRLEGLCKVYKTRIVVSEHTKDMCSLHFLMRKLDNVKVKGKHKPVAIFEVMEDTEELRELKEKYEKALEMYFSRQFEDAFKAFEKLAEEGDKTSEVFLERCEHYKDDPPQDDWDGSFTMKSK
ncbi:adenylate/guanylate cyclase with Chase sensor [Denitrovibrio acetiphilus DSM 12809]|uniref:Adenylate/guanylate cyclase with Chase sensor n=1 Tax=Denitrovibrio acetiphilus (strain DSM 12809 / NBRC 114555 / N2460) TaxID=522772 RepID=D4H7C5_DENA2|nr:adenylate/guanylate cyclase domain-containing protein [Denitrovibrio acetiphilus]ADD67924.1 adenylate/guanylate cyclase with Chase sensor [Denitrovibrio acetiphilus DSM 12809]